MTHKITSPIKQPQFSQTTMRQYWLGKPKPKQPFSLTQNVFKKLENMATVYSFNIMVCTHLLITLGLIWYHYFYCRYKCQCVLPGCTLFLELLAVFGWDYILSCKGSGHMLSLYQHVLASAKMNGTQKRTLVSPLRKHCTYRGITKSTGISQGCSDIKQ